MRFWILALSLSLLTACEYRQPVNILITNARIIDGSGAPAYAGMVAIDADTIAYVGTGEDRRFRAAWTLDAGGAVVAPGFIDPHTHALRDLSDSLRRGNLNYLYQGVTTVITGNDGGGPYDTADQLAAWDRQGIGTNAALLVGHRTVRQRVMSMSQTAPSAEELNAMRQLTAMGMNGGALGLSSGLFYAPASFARTEEVIELARVAARYGGIYDVHLRDESSYNVGLPAAVDETIRIAEEAGIPANISHIKALGVDVWGQSTAVIDRVEAARARGLRITADQYPYRASSTGLHAALLPRWVFADDPDYRDKLSDSTQLDRIREGMAENLRRRGGPEALLLTTPESEELKGMTLAEVAATWSVDPVEAAIRVMRNGSSSVVSFNMQEEDIVRFMQQPWVMTGSDGSTGHPRKYGSFPKKIAEYVFEKEVLTLPEMIRRSSSLPAEVFGIEKRGRLQTGYYADLILFHPERVRARASFDHPELYAEGMRYVFVNGVPAIERGAYTGALAGWALRRTTNVKP